MPKRVPVQLKLSPSIKAWIDRRVARGEFDSAESCVEEALRRAKMVHSRDDLEQAALRGLRSGPATPLTARDWDRMESEVRRRVSARQPRRKSA